MKKTKFFTNFDAWNPTVLRLEMLTANAALFATRKDNKKVPPNEASPESEENNDASDIVKNMIRPRGEVPSATLIVPLVNAIRRTCIRSEIIDFDDFYMYGLFLNEAASKKIILAMDRIIRDAGEMFEEGTKGYFRYIYKHLASLRSCVQLSYLDWRYSFEYDGFKSITAHDLWIGMEKINQMANSIKRIDLAYKVMPENWRRNE